MADKAVAGDTALMMTKTITAAYTVLALLLLAGFHQYAAPVATAKGPSPQSTGDAEMKFPEHYREWVYLSTGFDMSYSPAMRMGHDMFDNVFVNPEAYKVFQETGTWPDKTMLVLEQRGAVSKGSINRGGNFQGTDVMGLEVHMKDEARFPGKWAFFDSDDGKTAKMIPTTADCYSCHAAHAAVDTTFVQFYPTLLGVAQAKGTLSAAYRKDEEKK